MIVAYHYHHGIALAADIIPAAFAEDMAHGLLINWSPFFVVHLIALARPTQVEDGLRQWGCCLYFGALLLDFSSLEILL
jgi:hypothetical protein